jgi:hypothetical protein
MMAKKRTYKGIPEPTGETTAELRARRRWFMDLDDDVRCELIRQTRGMGTKEAGEFYRQKWIDAGETG